MTLLKRSMNESYDAIERTDIVASMGRVEQSFEASAASLKNQTNDWAVWNEMYRYALNPDPEWAKESIGEDALTPADITMAMIFAKSGQLLTASTVKHQDVNLNSLTPQMDAYLKLIKSDTQKTHCGIIRTDAGLMLTCSAGIVQSDASGRVAGTVVMGRLLDSSRQSMLRAQTKLPFELTETPELPVGLTRWPSPLLPGSIGSGEFWTSSDSEVYHLYYPVQDAFGEKVGMIMLDVPRSVHQQGLMLYQQVRQQLLWTVLIMTALLGLALHFLLIRRLRRFAKQIKWLETSSTWDRRIDVGGRDELGLVAYNVNKLLALVSSQVDGLRELLVAKETSLKVIQVTQAKLILSEQQALLGQQRVSNLLNNSGQGFFSFGEDLVINPEISRACTTMLGFSPAGRNAAHVLVSDDPVKRDLFCEIIPAVLAETDSNVRESMLSLLPAELSRDSTLLKAEYKCLENHKFMVVLTDITEERRLEKLVESEQRRLEFIVSVVSDRYNFFAAIDGFSEFLSNRLPREFHEGVQPQTLVSWLYREVHTYKGLFYQFGFIHVPTALHEVETRLSGLMSRGDALTAEDVAQAISPDDLRTFFEEDIALLTDALGKEFLENRQNIVLSSVLALQLEELAIRLLHGDAVDVSAIEVRQLLNEILILRKVTFKEVLLGFNGLVKQFAKRLGKEVAFIDVHGGDDFWLDPKPYQAFIQSLGHVFRNVIAHGLEAPEARWAAQKDEVGRITCHVSVENCTIKLIIADDGAGVDLDGLRQRAVAVGIYPADGVLDIPDEEIVALIFRDNMSTRTTVTQLSGRGVGLAAVLSETRKLGGQVAVKTVSGEGTQFLFSLPLQYVVLSKACDAMTSKEILKDGVELVMRSILAKTRDYFASEHEICTVEVEVADEEPDHLALLDLTAIIGLEGRINLQVAFSFQESLANVVYEWMTAGFNDYPDDIEKNRKAAVGELANTILGQCTKDIQHLDRQGIGMTPPIIIDRAATFPMMNSLVYCTRSFATVHGRLNIMLIGSREILNICSK